MKTDSHIHTDFSSDSQSPMEEMIQEGIRLGLTSMCFTEHYDLDFPPGDLDFLVDMPAYYSRFQELKEAYGSQIQLLFGIELGMQGHLAHRYEDFVGQYPFDFVIASQHLVDRVDPYYPAYWQGKTIQEAVAAYYIEVYSNLQSMTAYDSLGHLDYILRYAPTREKSCSYSALSDYIDPILCHLISQGKSLEVNSAGLKYGLGNPNPESAILRRYRELGGENITVGSDGHCPEHLAYDFNTLKGVLAAAGFHRYCIFRNRKPEYIRL